MACAGPVLFPVNYYCSHGGVMKLVYIADLKSPIGSVVVSCYLWNRAGVAESADASDLSANLSARRETGDAELLKFGEPCNLAIPSQALPKQSAFRLGRCRD